MRLFLLMIVSLALLIGCGEQNAPKQQDGNIDITRRDGAPGDHCGSSIDTLTESGTYTGTTAGLSNSFIAPRSCSDSYSGDKVYRISLDQTRRVVADLVDLEFDSVLYLKSSCETDGAVICNDDKSNIDYMSRISALLPAGEYFLVIDGYGTGSTGDYTLNLEIKEPDGGCDQLLCGDQYRCELNQGVPECVCKSGDCMAVVGATEGDLIITELMANPSGSDRSNEWIELYNTTDNPVKLEQFKIKKNNIYYPLNTKEISIPGKSYFVIARSPEAALPEINAVIPDLSLNNSGSHLIGIYINGVMIDSMNYSGSQSGVAIQRSGDSWCDARSAISGSNSDKGTPGGENLLCGDLCDHNCSDHGVCDVVDGSCNCETGYAGDICDSCDESYTLKNGVCFPVLSLLLNERDIIITELMPNPAGSDTTGEWIELYNRTDQELSLDGLKINRDDQSWGLESGFVIAPKGYFTIGRSNTAADGKIDGVITSMSFNNTSEHTVSIEISDLILDQISYNGSTEGMVKQLDIDRYDDEFRVENWCEKTGTPQSRNETCLTIVDPCLSIDCHHGECISDGFDSLCLCEPGYVGDLCDQCDPNNPDCPRPAVAGDLVITELMINPAGSDYHNEFIEIYNTAGHKIDLTGLTIQKDTTTYSVELINPVIHSGGYYLIARSNGDLFPEADGYCSFTLNNTGIHTISIMINEITLDQISYNGAKEGIAYQLDRAVFDVTQNDNPNFWCDATTTFSRSEESGDNMGTPGAANRGCGPCATLECPRHGVCVAQGDQASCVCDAGYHLNSDGLCEMDTQCGILYDQVRDLTGDELKMALQQLTGSPYNAIEYNISRKRMYREIDIDENDDVQCVYTGRKMKIVEGEELDSRYGGCSISTCVCSNPGMNTEHTWPQGTFNKTEPMKGDVHHLFPTDGCTNGRRSSFPFGKVSSPTGRFGNSEYGESLLGSDSDGKTVFEPADVHKGDVARAMFYFVVRYSNYSNFLTDKQEAILREWAAADPVSDKERIRNTKIEQMQWNRNPFVDCPQLIDQIADF